MTSKTVAERGWRVDGKWYNPDKSTLVCETPQGTLYRKRGASTEFYLFHAEGETARQKITPLTWADANNLVKTYAPREVHLKYFSTLNKETDHNKKGQSFSIDEYHVMKLQRNADAHHMRMTEYIKYLIDKDDGKVEKETTL